MIGERSSRAEGTQTPSKEVVEVLPNTAGKPDRPDTQGKPGTHTTGEGGWTGSLLWEC